ncbi:MAG: murE [Friedmanniella sp.]|nr:murE [Friedmanniella sp.]
MTPRVASRPVPSLGSVTEVSPVSRSAALRPVGLPPVALAELFGPASPGPADGPGAQVSGITLDSRLVGPGDLYVALPGRHHHGAAFVPAAVAAGAAAVLTDRAGGDLAAARSTGVPVVVVEDPRRVMAGVAARIYGRPAEALAMGAVTGTNGKTTTTFLLEAALQAAGRHTGLVGTIGFRLDGRALPTVRTTVTTPESPELQALLAYLRQEGADTVAMEVSSHALVLGRADAITFDVAAFTNFGRDHLDFHGDVESYFEAKASLFTPERTRHAVINVDDERGAVLAERVRAYGLGLTTLSLGPGADCFVRSATPRSDGRTAVVAQLGPRVLQFVLGMPGDFNLRNALTALAMAERLGADLDAAAAGLADAAVPGRMQRVDLGPDAPVVVVDFAHTPQAISAALQALGPGRRIAVLGCGGDRDPDKRAPMGAAAVASADVVVVTDDNPRSEDPAVIRAQILDGGRRAIADGDLPARLVDGGDRRRAIRTALELAQPGDVVAVLGKGHESGQEVDGEVRPFSDPDVVVGEWAAVRAGRDEGGAR